MVNTSTTKKKHTSLFLTIFTVIVPGVFTFYYLKLQTWWSNLRFTEVAGVPRGAYTADGGRAHLSVETFALHSVAWKRWGKRKNAWKDTHRSNEGQAISRNSCEHSSSLWIRFRMIKYLLFKHCQCVGPLLMLSKLATVSLTSFNKHVCLKL